MENIQSFFILGVKINAVSLLETINIMENWIRNGYKSYIVLTGAHGIIEMQKDILLKQINNEAGLVTPDGMPAVWLGKINGYTYIEKVYAPEIMIETFKISPAKGFNHFFYGGKEGVAKKLANVLRDSYPGINIVGTYCPPFRPLKEDEIIEIASQINQSQADIVWCGLGCPKQEKWMAQFRPKINAPVLIGVGAGFDFLSGEMPFAPKWIRRSGFEWLYRIFSDPKRLIKRYAYVVPMFILLLIAEKLKLYKNK